MKTFFLTSVLLLAGLCARADLINTRVLMPPTATASTNLLVASTKPTVLYSFSAYSTTTQYILLIQTNGVPANGATAIFTLPVQAGQTAAWDFGAYGAALDGVMVCASSTPNTLTLGTSGNQYMQAITKAN